MKLKKITKAILPVAGFGTRFLPATKAQPKEMLPLFDTPGIQLIIEEAVKAGIKDIILVTGKGKRSIEDHFDADNELESLLIKKGKEKELKLIQDISTMANFAYVRQSAPLGDGHAILEAINLVNDDESVVVLFGDDVVDNGNKKNSVEQLLEVYEKEKGPVVMLHEVPDSEVSKYGIVDYTKIKNKYGIINKFVEKPKQKEAPSNLAAIGKYIITPEIIKSLKLAKPSKDGEIRLANAFEDYLNNGGKIYGKILEGKRFDTGDKLGFLQATVHYAIKKEGDKAIQSILDILQ